MGLDDIIINFRADLRDFRHGIKNAELSLKNFNTGAFKTGMIFGKINNKFRQFFTHTKKATIVPYTPTPKTLVWGYTT